MGAGGDSGGGMAHFQRLMWFAVGVLLAALPMLAFADVFVYGVRAMNAQSVPALDWESKTQAFAGGYYAGSDGKAVADLVGLVSPGNLQLPAGCNRTGNDTMPVLQGTGTRIVGSVFYDEYRYRVVLASNCGGDAEIGVAVKVGVVAPECESGQRDEYGQCAPPECPPGEVWDSAQAACRMDCDLAASQPPSRSHVSQGGALCLMGCKRTRGAVRGGSNCVMQIDVSDGAGGLVCDYAWTGEQCDWTGEKGAGDDPAPNEPVAEDEGEPEQCGAGYVSGTVNGQQTCLLGGPPVDTVDKKTETKTNPDGTTETKNSTTETKVNPDGTVTTTTTTTTIVKDAAGNVVGTDVESVGSTQGKDGYCEEKPYDSVCGGGGSGELAGACVPGGGVQELVCDGDAIQCAIREQTMRTYCQLTASDDVVAEYEAIKSFDGTGEGEGLDRKQIDVPESLSVTEIGGGAGLQDQSFTIMGKTIVIPFSELNRFIEMFGYAIMAIAWLGAWRIIAGAF